MAQLTEDEIRVYETDQDLVNELPVLAAVQIFEGAACGDNASGFIRQLVAGDPFRGFACRGANNLLGASADLDVDLRRIGVIELLITSVAKADEGKSVYASDSNTFTLTEGSNTRIGYIIRVDVTGTAMVAFHDVTGDEAALIDNTGGTAGGSLASIGATYDAAEVGDALASLSAKINTILATQNN